MFDWLKKPDHPMHSPEEAAKLLAELPADDAIKALDEVNGWLASLREATGFKPELRAAVLEVLDHAGLRQHERLLPEYLAAPQLYEAKSQQRVQKLFAFWSRLLEAYFAAAAECEPLAAKSAPHKETLAVLVCRGLRAAASAAKTRHLCYQAVEPAIWEKLFKLYSMAEAARVAETSLQVYKSDPLPTSPAQELLGALMFEVASPGKLAPEHVELAWRITVRVASSFAIASRPDPELPFCVNLDDPHPPLECAVGGSELPAPRYFGAGTALARIEEMIKHNDSNVLPTERRFGKEFSVWDRVTVLHHLLFKWSAQPRRRSKRAEAVGQVAVLHGFQVIRKVMPQTGTSEMGAIAEALKEKQAQLSIAAEELDQVPEIWTLKDTNNHGLGADLAPAPDLWVKVGKICALKPVDDEAWWVGVIRRLDASNRAALHVGIEILSRRPRALWLKFVGEGTTAAANWETSSGSYSYDYLNVVLLFAEGARSMDDAKLLMDPEGFVADAVCEALMGEKSRLLKLGQPLATGDDFVITSCEWK